MRAAVADFCRPSEALPLRGLVPIHSHADSEARSGWNEYLVAGVKPCLCYRTCFEELFRRADEVVLYESGGVSKDKSPAWRRGFVCLMA